jgi:hypothetical protein
MTSRRGRASTGHTGDCVTLRNAMFQVFASSLYLKESVGSLRSSKIETIYKATKGTNDLSRSEVLRKWMCMRLRSSHSGDPSGSSLPRFKAESSNTRQSQPHQWRLPVCVVPFRERDLDSEETVTMSPSSTRALSNHASLDMSDPAEQTNVPQTDVIRVLL